MKRKILLVELWGFGDQTFSTPLIREAIQSYDVWLLGKPSARELLHPSYPALQFIHYDAPWTVFRGKYKLLKWDWRELFSVIGRLREQRFDIAASVRNDPRDHLFMWLTGARERYGYPSRGSGIFLNHPLTRRRRKQHKVEDWREIGEAIGLPGMAEAGPSLRPRGYFSQNVEDAFAQITKPVICLHAGARIGVRRWPEEYFGEIVRRLRRHFDFHLILVPEPDGYGSVLAPLADTFIRSLSVRELVDVLGRCDLLLCNDSGPAHIAACCGRPTIPIFGPTDPDWFRPWGSTHKIIIRDICPWRPCFDYCKFAEPHCMTKLQPDTAWPEIEQHIRMLIADGVLPAALLKPLLPDGKELQPAQPVV